MTGPDSQTSELHIPYTGAGGVFGGERGTSGVPQFVVLDDGKLTELAGAPAVDHDARTLSFFKDDIDYAPELSPPAVRFERTPERFRYRDPAYTWRDAVTGEEVTYTHWVMGSGTAVNVQERAGGVNRWRFYDTLQRYDGGREERAYPALTQTQTVRAWDFQWEFFLPRTSRDAYRTPDADTTRVADAYREVVINKWGSDPKDVHQLVQTYVQGHVRGVWRWGDVAVGWLDGPLTYFHEVTAVRGHHYSEQTGEVIATLVDCWLTIASLTQQTWGVRPPGATPLMDWVAVYGEGAQTYSREYRPVAYVTRRGLPLAEAATVLRDIERTAWGQRPMPTGPSFRAWGGAVRVDGPRQAALGRLDGGEGEPAATLTAFGHTFRGGTWAALRDTPLVREDGTMDWERVIVLHASKTTVTAVRPDGSRAAIPREQFEREILRVSPGAFVGFNSVGTLFNTWPPQWAWCDCQGETRAIAAHDPWRDSYKRGEAPDAPKRPTHWNWTGRPGRRPQKPPPVPAAPLGLTLADVTGAVEHDEPLRRGEAPLLLPLTATVAGEDVRAKVAKRVLYPPAEWPEELNDRTSTRGPLTLTFKLPDPPRPASGDDPGETWEAALVLRLRTRADTITVNGESVTLSKLGHNADERRGWHPYVVPVPVAAAYTLEYEGQCSRALLCVRVMPVPGESGPILI
ncbi:hypothetical protein [Deinococcus murrayi]|uniref:hypothetical protein n=1 Tax=Deinococcus murrayi TaxID=68910 RepID=UPI0004895836|nr:hypothetical protein [Deinococcus murrayi]